MIRHCVINNQHIIIIIIMIIVGSPFNNTFSPGVAKW